MRNKSLESSIARFLVGASWLSLVAAALTAVVALFSHWGVNAEVLGAHDAGWALFLAFVGAVALVGATHAVPVLLAIGLLSLSLSRRSALRFLAAGAACAVPVVALTWLQLS
jgi:hypothetical protein